MSRFLKQSTLETIQTVLADHPLKQLSQDNQTSRTDIREPQTVPISLAVVNMAQPRPPSPSASLQSTHSFLDEDPYPSGVRRPLSSSTTPHHQHDTEPDAHLTNSALLNRLESLLRSKAEEVQLAGQLGQALLEQQSELEIRIREIAEVSERYAKSTPGRSSATGDESTDGEREIGDETRQKLRELEQDLVGYEGANSELYQTVGRAAQRGVPTVEELQQPLEEGDYPTTSPSTVFDSPLDTSGAFQDPNAPPPSTTRRRAPSLSGSSKRPDLSSILPPSADSTTDASSSRRARNNAQHRNNDLELATDIGQSLLVEVRRLQALLQEKDEHLQASNKEKDAMAVEVESALQARRTMEESVGKFWNNTFSFLLASTDMPLCPRRTLQGGQLGTRTRFSGSSKLSLFSSICTSKS